MFVGYAIDHDGDVYRMWNPNTNRVLVSRDVIWLKRMYFEPKEIPEIEVQPAIEITKNVDLDEEEMVVVEQNETAMMPVLQILLKKMKIKMTRMK